jgi:four helix bundle protein
MHIPLRQQILEDVLHTIELMRPLVAAVSRRDRDLASQIRRALSSVALNVSEGFGSAAGNARLRFESARGSLYEAHAGIRVAIAWGYFSAEDAAAALEAMDRLGGRVFGLARR